jgi:hypothetical protein
MRWSLLLLLAGCGAAGAVPQECPALPYFTQLPVEESAILWTTVIGLARQTWYPHGRGERSTASPLVGGQAVEPVGLSVPRSVAIWAWVLQPS